MCLGQGGVKGRGQRNQNQHVIHQDKLFLEKPGRLSLPAHPLPVPPSDSPPPSQGHTHVLVPQGPILSQASPFSTCMRAKTNGTQVFRSVEHVPVVRHETHFLKFYFNSYAFTFLCLRKNITSASHP